MQSNISFTYSVRAVAFDDGSACPSTGKMIEGIYAPGFLEHRLGRRANIDTVIKHTPFFRGRPDHPHSRLGRGSDLSICPRRTSGDPRAAPAQGALRRAEIKPVEHLASPSGMEQLDLHRFRSAICLRLVDRGAERDAEVTIFCGHR